MELLALVTAYILVGLIGILGLRVAWMTWTGGINLSLLVNEKDGAASFSRFQFLIFTFVIAMCVLVLTLETGQFPVISPEILALMGMSAGSYAVSKGIEANARSKKLPSGDPK